MLRKEVIARTIHKIHKSRPKKIFIETNHGIETKFEIFNNSLDNGHGRSGVITGPIKGAKSSSISLNINRFAKQMLLPIGYPHSVHSCYKKTHVYQFLETTSGSIIATLCAHSLLASVGVSNSAAEAATASVAIKWVLKDGVGEILKLLFIQQASYLFDSYPKTAKLMGELLSISGAYVQLLTVFYPPQWFLPLASIAFCFRGIHYSIWSATHTTFCKLSGDNIGDLISKDDAQVSLAHLIGLLTGVSLLSFFSSPATILPIFCFLSAVQVYCTVLFVQNANFEVLNTPRLQILSNRYIQTNGEAIYTIKTIPESWLGEFPPVNSKSPSIHQAKSIRQLFQDAGIDKVEQSIALFENEKFLIVEGGKEYWILLQQGAAGTDYIKALLLISKWNHLVRSHEKIDDSVIQEAIKWTDNHIDAFYDLLDANGWKRDSVVWPDLGVRFRLQD